MKSKSVRFFAAVAAVLAVLSWAGCVTCTHDTEARPPLDLQTLRVGFAPNYPPICMADDGGKPTGLEAEFAAALADELGCGLEIVPLDFGELFGALFEGKVDILMSGLTVTPARAYRMRFCKPYLSNPLVAATRAGWARSYASASHVLSTSTTVGVLPNTYPETFVRRHCPRARTISVTDYDTVPKDLELNHYSVYIDDLAAILDLAAKHPGTIEVIPYPLQQQDIAWAVHPSNASLLSAANAALDKWKANGRLDAMLDHWLPERFR